MNTRREVRTQTVGAVTVVELIGEHDIANAPEIGRYLAQSDGHDLVIDLTAATFIDSAILALILRQHQRQEHETTVVAPENGFPRRALQLTGLEHGLNVVDNITQAVPAHEC